MEGKGKEKGRKGEKGKGSEEGERVVRMEMWQEREKLGNIVSLEYKGRGSDVCTKK